MAPGTKGADKNGKRVTAAAAAARATAAAALAELNAPATTRDASHLPLSESQREMRAREKASARTRAYRARQKQAKLAADAQRYLERPEDGSSVFQFKANGERRASIGAAYVAKSARVTAIVKAILATGTKAQQAEALSAAIQNPEVLAVAIQAGLVTSVEARIVTNGIHDTIA
jgi:hypothetical protein